VQGGEAARLHTCASVGARPPGGRELPSASAPRRPTRSAAERPPRRRPPAGAVDRVPHHPTLPRAAAAAAAGRRPRAVPPHPTRARQPRQGLRPSCRHRGAIFMRAVRSASSPPAPAHGTSIGNTGGRSIVNNAVVLWAPPTRMPPACRPWSTATSTCMAAAASPVQPRRTAAALRDPGTFADESSRERSSSFVDTGCRRPATVRGLVHDDHRTYHGNLRLEEGA
jgi:hypothetical protein